MEARETDKLFREKLKHTPSIPKSESWEKLESMLDEQEKAPFFTLARVAAAVLLLLISGLVLFFFQADTSQSIEVAEVKTSSESLKKSHVIVPEVKLDENEETEEVEPVEIQKKLEGEPKPIKATKPVFRKEKTEEIEQTENSAPTIIEEQQLAQMENNPTEVEDTPLEKKKIKSIRITYKRGSNPLLKQDEMVAQQKVDSTENNKIKELWEQTREIKPGDLWADIRDAKDNLFQRNSKKNNVKNLNK
ncbi:MAG: hypothetical protein ABJH98_07085 [Reichenbachiella sp.]|uniref:hypothetical protein n=1 Tax=Reichenbachiella sp. TaxID=2184521 RepID=UPI00329801F4